MPRRQVPPARHPGDQNTGFLCVGVVDPEVLGRAPHRTQREQHPAGLRKRGGTHHDGSGGVEHDLGSARRRRCPPQPELGVDVVHRLVLQPCHRLRPAHDRGVGDGHLGPSHEGHAANFQGRHEGQGVPVRRDRWCDGTGRAGDGRRLESIAGPGPELPLRQAVDEDDLRRIGGQRHAELPPARGARLRQGEVVSGHRPVGRGRPEHADEQGGKEHRR